MEVRVTDGAKTGRSSRAASARPAAVPCWYCQAGLVIACQNWTHRTLLLGGNLVPQALKNPVSTVGVR
jgi:hypothetical protein